MRSWQLLGAALATLAALLPALGCSRSEAPRGHAAPADYSEFSSVLARLADQAKDASGGGATVKIGPPSEEIDGRRTLNATLIRSASSTSYTLSFRRLADRWVCCGAVAEETEAGGKSSHRLGGDAIEIDQLIIWLGWKNADS